jgi:hypothetical protein
MSMEDVAHKVEWSTSKLVRIEGGQVGISVSDLNALLAIYEVGDQAQQEELRKLARATQKRTWWSAYQRHVPPPYLEFIGEESDADRIRTYHPTIVPGLFQTAAYTKAIIEATALNALPPEAVEARAEVRRRRQEHILERAAPPTITMVLDEAVLRRPVGGQLTMREQLDHLMRLAKRKNVCIVVVRFSAGPHPGLVGAFALLEYDDGDDILCLETATRDVVLRDDPDVVRRYSRAAERLVTMALSEQDSIRFIAEVRESYR